MSFLSNASGYEKVEYDAEGPDITLRSHFVQAQLRSEEQTIDTRNECHVSLIDSLADNHASDAWNLHSYGRTSLEALLDYHILRV